MTIKNSVVENKRDIMFFLSSTFEDMEEERQAVKEAIKSLQSLAFDRGVNLRLVDLRLGVEKDVDGDDQEIYNGKTVKVCLDAIDRCKPYFIGLLGNRYGWQPKMEDLGGEIPDNFKDEHKDLLKEAIHEGKSITEMEILLGVLKHDDVYASIYIADEEAYKLLSREEYVELQLEKNKKRDEPLPLEKIREKYEYYIENDELRAKQAVLKNTLKEKGWVRNTAFKTSEEVYSAVVEDVRAYIDTHYPNDITEDERRKLREQSYLREKTLSYVDRKDVRARMDRYMKNSAHSGERKKPLLICGKSGIGKSTAIANWQKSYQINKADVVVHSYYIGVGNVGNRETDLIRCILSDLKMGEPHTFSEDIPDSKEELRPALAQWLNRIRKETVIIIDGVNQLTEGKAFDWLPVTLPNHVSLMISTADNDDSTAAQLKKVLELNEKNILHMDGLNDREQKELINNEFKNKYGKSDVPKEIDDTIMSLEYPLRSNPLFLETILGEIVEYASRDALNAFMDDYIADKNKDSLIDLTDVFVRLIEKRMENYNSQYVAQILGLILVSKNGLSEDMIFEILNQENEKSLNSLEFEKIMGSLRNLLLSFDGKVKYRHAYVEKSVDHINQVLRKTSSQALCDYCENQNQANGMQFDCIEELMYQLMNLNLVEKMTILLSSIETYVIIGSHDLYREGLVWLSKHSSLETVQNVLLKLLEQKERVKEAGLIVTLIGQLNDNGMLQEGLKLAEEEFEEQIVNDPGLIKQKTLTSLNNLAGIYRRMGRLEEALSHYETCYAQSKQVLGEQNPDTLRSLNNLGYIYQRMGRLEEALSHYETCYAQRKQVLGEQNPDTLISLNNLAGIYEAMGRLEEALSHYETCYAQSKQVLGEQNPDTLRSLNNLGYIYQRMGRLEEALSHYETCYAQSKQVLGEQNPDTLRSLNNLGYIYQRMGRLEEALSHYETCYAQRKQVLGEQNPDTLRSLNNLAVIYEAMGRLEEALSHFETCYAQRKQVLGEENPDTLSSLNNLAVIYETMGRLEEALSHFETCYAQSKQVLGEQNPSTLSSLNNLAGIYEAMGRLEEALSHSETCYAQRKQVLGEQNPSTLSSLNNLAGIYQRMGRLEEALSHYETCYAQRKQVLGEQNPDTLTSLNNLGYIYQRMGRLEEALSHYETCYAQSKQVLGEQNPDTLTSLNNLGYIYQRMGRLEEALSHYETCYAQSKQVLGEQNPDTLRSLNNLGYIYQRMGRLEEALSHYETCYAQSKQVLGEQNPSTLRSLNNLAGIYEAMGRLEEALSHYETCYAQSKQVLGEQNPDTLRSLNNLGYIYQRMGRLEEALSHYETCYAQSKQVLGEQNPDTLRSLNNLAGIYQRMGRLEEALSHYETCYAQSKQVLGENNPDTINTKVNMAICLTENKKFDSGFLLIDEALIASRKIGDGGRTFYSLGTGIVSKLLKNGKKYFEAKAYEDAKRLLEKAYKIGQSLDVKLKNRMFQVHDILFSVEYELGSYELSLLHLEETIGILLENPKEHASILSGRYKFKAAILNRLKKFGKAADALSHVIDFMKESGADTKAILQKCDERGVALIKNKSYEEAVVVLGDCYNNKCEVLGSEHPSTIITLNNLAYAYNEIGNHKKAEELHSECLEKRVKTFGSASKEASSSHNNLGRVYVNTGDYKKAEMHLQKAIEIRGKLGLDMLRLGSLKLLGGMYEKQDRRDDVLTVYGDALKLAKSLYNEKDERVVEILEKIRAYDIG